MVFWIRPRTRLFIDTLIFWETKGVQVVHIWAKFHLRLTCSSRVFKFQMLSKHQKVWFQAGFGWLFVHNSPKFGQICLKYSPVIQWNVMHQICHAFHCTIKKWSKLSQKKLIFWLFLKGFQVTPSYAQWVTLEFLGKWKVSWRYIILVSFISITFVVVKLCIFKGFRSSVK